MTVSTEADNVFTVSDIVAASDVPGLTLSSDVSTSATTAQVDVGAGVEEEEEEEESEREKEEKEEEEREGEKSETEVETKVKFETETDAGVEVETKAKVKVRTEIVENSPSLLSPSQNPAVVQSTTLLSSDPASHATSSESVSKHLERFRRGSRLPRRSPSSSNPFLTLLSPGRSSSRFNRPSGLSFTPLSSPLSSQPLHQVPSFLSAITNAILPRRFHNTSNSSVRNSTAARSSTSVELTRSPVFIIHEGTEDSDLQIIARDLQTRCSTSLPRAREKPSQWVPLLLNSQKPVSVVGTFPLRYVRTSCTCLTCKASTALRSDRSDFIPYTRNSSALANFVRLTPLPHIEALRALSGQKSQAQLHVGTLVRLHSRSSAKFLFSPDLRQLFQHLAYTGPCSHENMYRSITTIGVNYYQNNKGHRERRVFLVGHVVKFSIRLGVVKLDNFPLCVDELGSRFVLYRSQRMHVYVGELALEGNSVGSFIPTGIQFHIGFGEDSGCAPIYSKGSVGPARRLGVNELLLHHHMTEPLELNIL